MILKVITLTEAKTLVGNGRSVLTTDINTTTELDALAKLLKEQPKPFRVVVVVK
jgi:hypothetical protein